MLNSLYEFNSHWRKNIAMQHVGCLLSPSPFSKTLSCMCTLSFRDVGPIQTGHRKGFLGHCEPTWHSLLHQSVPSWRRECLCTPSFELVVSSVWWVSNIKKKSEASHCSGMLKQILSNHGTVAELREAFRTELHSHPRICVSNNLPLLLFECTAHNLAAWPLHSRIILASQESNEFFQ